MNKCQKRLHEKSTFSDNHSKIGGYLRSKIYSWLKHNFDKEIKKIAMKELKGDVKFHETYPHGDGRYPHGDGRKPVEIKKRTLVNCVH